jgi:uncharacterized protein
MAAKCPHCGKETGLDGTNPFRPFCSERCKLIDLSHWISGTYRIPEKENAEEEIDVRTEELADSDKK